MQSDLLLGLCFVLRYLNLIMIKTFNTTPQHYRIYIFSYGIISVLNVLKHYEEIENYEECKKIMDAINENEKELGIKPFTRISNEAIQHVIEQYVKHNIKGEFVISQSQYYSSLIIKEIDTKLTTKIK